MLNIALPKGRLGDKVYKIFKEMGYSVEEMEKDTRKLFFINEEKGVRFFLVKPSDVGVYVERGVADIGVVGKDTLLESRADVYELLDLELGKCKMCVCSPNDYIENPSETLVVATKYPNITKDFYDEQNRDINIIKLNGSIEIAPILGLSHVIVDIVETGGTLRENNLKVDLDIVNLSARLIACKSNYNFKRDIIDDIVRRMKK